MYSWIKDFEMIKKANVNSADLEKAFIDMSYNAVSLKAGRLMEDPYRIGFEIVYSNDDNSKMAAMYAFRIGKNLISVPVIFANGAIKGVELMYEHKVKLMRPLDPTWVEHLINKTELKEGEAIAMEKADRLVQNPRLNIFSGIGINKRASEDDSAKKAWEEVFNCIEQNLNPCSSSLPDVVKSNPELVMSKIAAALDKSMEFAEAIAGLDEEVLFPAIEKQAAALPENRIEIAFDVDLEKFAKEDLKEFTQKGYRLWDMRPEDQLNYVMDEIKDEYHQVKTPGMYKVLTATGDEVEVLIGNRCKKDNISYEWNKPNYNTELAIFFPESKAFEDSAYSGSCTLVAIEDKEKESSGTFLTEGEEEFGTELPSTGNYVAYNKQTKMFSPVFRVKEQIKSNENITTFRISNCCGTDSLIVNKAITDDEYPNYGRSCCFILGQDNVFLKLKEKDKNENDNYSTDYPTGYGYDGDPLLKYEELFKFLKNRGLKRVKVKADDEIEEYKVYENEKPIFSGQGNMMLGQTKLAAHYGLTFEDAERIIKEASYNKEKSFWVIPNGEFTKEAAVYFTDRPNFQKEYNNVNAVMEDPEQTHVSQSERTVLSQPIKNLGYGMDLNQGVTNGMVSEEAGKKGFTDSDLMNKTPEELSTLASSSRVSNLFEHGLVGSLVTTYDSAALIENYIPSLEKGLDHFGRILFLLYWKPADFEKLYGSDDMPLLENKLKSQFKSMGDLVLELIKKNEKVKGTVATP
jgi:hypothetical protein